MARVLVVDDDMINRMMLTFGVEQEGHTVGTAEDGEQALQTLASDPYDLVLLDVVMPNLDGFQVLEHMKSDPALREIPVIMVSAQDEIDSVVRCIEMGAEDYLPKPFNPTLLRARVGACIAKKGWRDQELLYLQQVEQLTAAAAAVEAHAFRAEELDPIARREDQLGRLARVFQEMAREVQAREEGLRREVRQLRIEIDEAKKVRQVADLTETDYFQQLQSRAQELRRRPRVEG